MTLEQDLQAVVNDTRLPGTTRNIFASRLSEGQLTRDENSTSHFCVYFLPYDPKTKNVLLIAHKKSGLWLAPGGHIDRGENLHQAVNREIREELGVSNFFPTTPRPFFISTVDIVNQKHGCRRHHDVWYLISLPPSRVHINFDECSDARWVDHDAALAILTDPSNIEAINIILPA